MDVEFVTASPFKGKVGQRLVDAVTARAVGSSGQGVSGAEVFFFSDHDVTFDPPSVISDARGDATTTVILGCNPRGKGEISAGLSDGDVLDKINFDSEAGEVAGLFKVRGDNQSGSPGQRLSRAPVHSHSGISSKKGNKKCPKTSSCVSGSHPSSMRCRNQIVSSGMLPYQISMYCEKAM